MQRIFGFSRILSSGAPAPACTVTVYDTGTANLSTIYADDLVAPTPLANPFVADANGFWFFYTKGGRYDVTLSGGGIVVPYTLADIPAGLGDGAVTSYTQALLPGSGAAHVGRLFRLTDQQQGLWINDGAGIVPVLDFGFRSFAKAGLPAAAIAGRLRRVTDEYQGLYLDDGAVWNSLLAYAFPGSTKAGLPAPSLAGRLRRVSDDARGLWVDTSTRWFGLGGEQANVVEFGAARDGVTDDLASIQAAINALTAGGAVLLPKGTYAVSGPILLRDGVALRGLGASLVATAGFAGDSMLSAFRRDDNVLTNEDHVEVSGLIFTAPAAPAAGFSCVDLTGFTDSVFSRLRLLGPGSSLNGSALRIADQNPTASSAKRCQNNLVEQVYASNWSRFLTVAQAVAGRSDHNVLVAFRAILVRTGIDFTNLAAGVARLALLLGQLVGDANAASVDLTPALPGAFLGLQLDVSSFTTARLPAELTFNLSPGLGASGTSSTVPLDVGGALAQSFFGSAYLKIGSGVALVGGPNAFVYTLTGAPAGASFIAVPVSGVPIVPVTIQAALSGVTLTVTVVAASPVVLPSNFVFRVVQVA